MIELPDLITMRSREKTAISRLQSLWYKSLKTLQLGRLEEGARPPCLPRKQPHPFAFSERS
jgi:hypothetical protein